MAVGTLGTDATTSLDSVAFSAGLAAADVASIANAIKDDLNPAAPIFPGAFSLMGLLYIPNRGILQLRAGDRIGVDNTGWPILVSANSIANGSSEWTVV
jgi:hypothetical protein